MFEQNHGLTHLQKMQTFQVPNINLFVVYEGFLCQERLLTLFEPKKQGEETSNF